MLNQQETNSSAQVDKFTEALASARRMQQDWLQYGINFLHIYVDDVEGNWLENWGSDEISDHSLLDSIKEFLVSEDYVAVKIRQALNHQNTCTETSLTLFDLAINLAECCKINREPDRLSAVRDILIWVGKDDPELWDLANNLIEKLAFGSSQPTTVEE